jgi:hypothetical protein
MKPIIVSERSTIAELKQALGLLTQRVQMLSSNLSPDNIQALAEAAYKIQTISKILTQRIKDEAREELP